MTMQLEDYRGDERIDSRDLIELRAALADELDSTPSRDELREAIAAIDELADSGIEDWQYGATMIREDKFVDYARELAEDIGALDADASWPMSCIDWEQAARELSMDYMIVEFVGYDYWVRA